MLRDSFGTIEMPGAINCCDAYRAGFIAPDNEMRKQPLAISRIGGTLSRQSPHGNLRAKNAGPFSLHGCVNA